MEGKMLSRISHVEDSAAGESETQRTISLPTELMEAAYIEQGADIQIYCVDNAIIIAKEPALSIHDLQSLLNGLALLSQSINCLPGYRNLIPARPSIFICAEKQSDDIPMQRQTCHEFTERQG
jgi:antitoxin component of MazEF toxin-antitoxin module